MGSVGTEHLPLFEEPTPRPSAQALSADGLARAVRMHPAEFQRCVGIAKDLAKNDTANRGLTIDMVRRAAGLLTSTGRDLSFLGGVLRAAGLMPTGEYRRSEIPGSHGNPQIVWRAAR